MILLLYLLLGLLTLSSNYLLLPFNQLQHFPSYFLAILIKALKVRANIGDNLGCFIFLNESDDGENVEDLRYKVFEVEIFLLIHEGLNDFFNA